MCAADDACLTKKRFGGVGRCGDGAVHVAGKPGFGAGDDLEAERGDAFELRANLYVAVHDRVAAGGLEHAGDILGALDVAGVNLERMSKAEIIHAGAGPGVDYGLTVSCYQADADGTACGICDACRLRAEGFRAATVDDPTRYRA